VAAGAAPAPVLPGVGIRHQGYSKRLQRVMTDFVAEESFQSAAQRLQEHTASRSTPTPSGAAAVFSTRVGGEDDWISGMKLGWELPGSFDVEMQVRGLSLLVDPRVNPSATPVPAPNRPPPVTTRHPTLFPRNGKVSTFQPVGRSLDSRVQPHRKKRAVLS
jgi:hypothetical protein